MNGKDEKGRRKTEKKMSKVELTELIESGAHFGHLTRRWNPKMKPYIFMEKNGIHIIDLKKTQQSIDAAAQAMTEIVSTGKKVLFVGTKKQAKKIVESAAKKCGMPSVTERWLGGTFTNFSVISGRTRYLREGSQKQQKGEFAKYTKFEQMKKAEELERLENKMGGIREMMKLPGAIFIASVMEDNIALKEAKNKGIPVIALVDTNIDPTDVDYPIPANEDAVSSLKLMLAYITKAVLDGKEKKEKSIIEEKVISEK